MPTILPTYANAQVVEAQERAGIDICLSDIIAADGSLKFLEQAQNRGLIEVRQSANRLHLKIGGVVGYLPVTENLVLNIRPKFPISNLARIVAMSEKPLLKTANMGRYYQVENNDFLPEALIRGLAVYSKDILETGVQKSYYKTTHYGTPRPKLNLRKSQQRYWGKGNQLSAVSDQFDFGPEIFANQILKQSALRALAITRNRSGFAKEDKVFKSLINGLGNISVANDMNYTADITLALSDVASFRAGYRRALPVAVELLKRTNLSFSGEGSNVSLPSFLLNLDDMFEAYIRVILNNHFQGTEGSGFVRDGNNKRWSKKLLKNSSRFDAKPDLIFYSNDFTPVALGDTKYKGKQSETDRYQIISHALAYGVNKALLIYPATHKKSPGLHRLGKIGPVSSEIELYEYYFDLNNDLGRAEKLLISALSPWLKEAIK